MRSRMAWRTAGKVGWGGGPLILFFPPCSCKAAMLEEGVRDHRHERMAVKALPGSSLEVIETEFFLQLLVSLFANPSRLDGSRQGAQVGLCRQVGEIVLLREVVWVILDQFRTAVFFCCCRCGHVGNALALSIISTALPAARAVDLGGRR